LGQSSIQPYNRHRMSQTRSPPADSMPCMEMRGSGVCTVSTTVTERFEVTKAKQAWEKCALHSPRAITSRTEKIWRKRLHRARVPRHPRPQAAQAISPSNLRRSTRPQATHGKHPHRQQRRLPAIRSKPLRTLEPTPPGNGRQYGHPLTTRIISTTRGLGRRPG